MYIYSLFIVWYIMKYEITKKNLTVVDAPIKKANTDFVFDRSTKTLSFKWAKFADVYKWPEFTEEEVYEDYAIGPRRYTAKEIKKNKELQERWMKEWDVVFDWKSMLLETEKRLDRVERIPVKWTWDEVVWSKEAIDMIK